MFQRTRLANCMAIVLLMSANLFAQEIAEEQPRSVEREAAQPTFLRHLQQYYEQARQSGSTTASSAAHWLSEQYDSTAKGASDAAGATTKWVTDLYNHAVESGETSASNAKDWVVEDLSQIGTWQYKVLRIQSSTDVEKELNVLGSQRWEAFSVERQGNVGGYLICLKRPHRSYLRQLPAKDLMRLLPLGQGQGDAGE